MNILKIRLGIAMVEKGFNFAKLSKASGISKTTLSAINKGKSCKVEIVVRIAKALEVSPEYLIGEDVTYNRLAR
jgi:DNA-binding Xre family transcriptional regulator